MDPELDIETKATFSDKVIEFSDDNDLNLIDGLSAYIAEKGIEVEEVKMLLTNELKALIYEEARQLNFFRTKHPKVLFDD